MVAEPKLRKVDKLMVNDSDREYISQWARKGYWRGGLAGTAVALVSGSLMMRRVSKPSAALLGSACGVLTGLFGVASVVPQAMRQGILTLHNSSPLKMSLFHVYVTLGPRPRAEAAHAEQLRYAADVVFVSLFYISIRVIRLFSPKILPPPLLSLPASCPRSVQQLNPDLSPSQIYTMVHRHERLAGRPTEPAPAPAALETAGSK
jgi:hypothetical protein